MFYPQTENNHHNGSNKRTFGKDLTNLIDNTICVENQYKKILEINGPKENNFICYSFGKNQKHENESLEKKNLNQTKSVYYGDPQKVEFYEDEIFTYLHQKKVIPINPQYMKEIQKDLNPKMRAILIDWLVLVHRKFKFNPETLFLAIEIIDRFLQKSPIPRQLLQLVGVSSILIASKIEEIYFPEIWDLVAMTDGAYSCKDIVEMEANIASALEFEFGFVCPIFFFDYYARKVQFDEKKRFFGHFVMELCMLEYSMLKYTKVVIAAGAFYLCNCVFGGEKKGNLWFQLPFEEIEIKDVAKEMLAIHLYQEKTKLKEIRVKYENEKFLKVANVKLEHIVM